MGLPVDLGKYRMTTQQRVNNVYTVYIAGQRIVKALTFNGQRIVGLCKSLTVNAVKFYKVGNG